MIAIVARAPRSPQPALPRSCPHCASPVSRVHRRFVDRLCGALILLPLRRYRCVGCGWQGNLLARPLSGRHALGSDADYRGDRHRI